MTSLNNHSPRENHGSALVVTILLVSVMLTAALILLQRIIPYAKNVRGMNDAMQSYYTARGEVEAARLGFFYGGGLNTVYAWHLPTLFGFLSTPDITSGPTNDGRVNVTPRLPNEEERFEDDDAYTYTVPNPTGPLAQKTSYQTVLKIPKLHGTRPNRDHIVVALNRTIPVSVSLYSTDVSPKQFGTSQRHSAYHTLSSKSGGGLRFDLRDVDTSSSTFGLTLGFLPGYAPTSEAVLTVKIQYTAGAIVRTFTVEYDQATANYRTNALLGLFNLTGNGMKGVTQDIDSFGGVTIDPVPKDLAEFLNINKCNAGGVTSCSLTLTLGNSAGGVESSADFQLISTGSDVTPIPDLNAVVVGDGLSDNGLYFQRVIDLIPTRQDI